MTSPAPSAPGPSPHATASVGPIPNSERTGRLEALCWCEHRIVHVPATDIRQGRTGTCGRTNCHPPEAS